MMLTVTFVFVAAAQAQKKCSDKPIAVEFQKVKQRQEARKLMLQKTQQDGVQTTTTTTTTTSSQQTKPQPINKPSSQPMSIPSRKKNN